MSDRIVLSDFTPAALVDAIRAAGYSVVRFETESPMPTVRLAASALGVEPSSILKTLLFESDEGDVLRVIACGTDRIDRNRLERLSGVGRLKMASPDRVLASTGWPAGGVAPIGSRHSLSSWVDRRVTLQKWVWGGGGTEWTLIGMNSADIVTITNATVADLIGT